MAKRKGSSGGSGPRTRSKAAKERREAREAENAQRLDKLPPEVWEKILDHLDENDLFPLALSCRYFRQKQKELVVERTWLALKTTLRRKIWDEKPVSLDYLRFCCKEKVSKDDGQKRDKVIRRLAAFHGHPPLLQELLRPLNTLDREITEDAGES